MSENNNRKPNTNVPRSNNIRRNSSQGNNAGTGRPISASSGRRPVARRDIQKRQTSMQRADTDNRSLVKIIKDNALAKQRKKDKEWENTEIERQRHGVDRPMLIIILILLCVGTIMVFSASYPSALKEKNDSLYYIRNQLMWVSIGGAAMTIASFVPYQIYKKFSPSIAILGLLLLVLVLVMGTARGVAQRWLIIGPVSVQASEPAKAALILYLSYYIDKYYHITSKGTDKTQTFCKGIVIPGIIVGLFAGLVLLEKHLSGCIILGLIGVAIIFMSGADIMKMALTYGIPAVCVGAGYLLTNEYALKRLLTHSDENADVLAEAWQTTQGLYAIGSGGLLGMGLGESNLKYNYVSEAHNDFIFTIWCEELGLVGALLLVCIYGCFVWRGILIAKKAPDTFSSLVAFGITFQVGIQAALNLMVVTDLIPNTGVSLPFMSYGGSSLLMLMGEMGVLLSISKHSYQKK